MLFDRASHYPLAQLPIVTVCVLIQRALDRLNACGV